MIVSTIQSFRQAPHGLGLKVTSGFFLNMAPCNNIIQRLRHSKHHVTINHFFSLQSSSTSIYGKTDSQSLNQSSYLLLTLWFPDQRPFLVSDYHLSKVVIRTRFHAHSAVWACMLTNSSSYTMSSLPTRTTLFFGNSAKGAFYMHASTSPRLFTACCAGVLVFCINMMLKAEA